MTTTPLALTEQRNPATENIDQLSTEDVCRLINRQDALTPLAVAEALPQISRAVDLTANALERGRRVFYLGAGTSGRLGVLDASELLPTFGLPPGRVIALIAGGDRALRDSIEAAEDDAKQGEHDLLASGFEPGDVVVGIAASGRTPYAIGAMRYAKQSGSPTVAIVCAPDSPMAEMAEVAVEAVTGPEVITGSTRMKAGTAQKMVLNILSTATMIKLGKVYGNLMVDVQVTNAKLAQRALRIVSEATGVSPTEAQQLLDASGSDVKTAIVMGVLSCSAPEARQKLDATSGSIRRAV